MSGAIYVAAKLATIVAANVGQRTTKCTEFGCVRIVLERRKNGNEIMPVLRTITKARSRYSRAWRVRNGVLLFVPRLWYPWTRKKNVSGSQSGLELAATAVKQ